MTDFTVIKTLFGLSEPVGFRDELIQLGIEENGGLPQVLIDYYSELGEHEGLNCVQDYLVKPQQLQGYETDDFLVFWCENQDITQWGIRKEDLHLPNPPVYANCDENGWEKEKDSLTEFFDMAAHFQSLFALPYRNEGLLAVTAEKAKLVRKTFRRKEVQMPDWYGVEFYCDEADCVIGLTKSGDSFGLMYASNSEVHFKNMESALCQR